MKEEKEKKTKTKKKTETKFETPIAEYITAVTKKTKSKVKAEVKTEPQNTVATQFQYNNVTVKMFVDNDEVPTYAHDGDLGMDIVATSVEYDCDNDAFIYGTGIYVESDRHTGCLVFPRSSIYKTDAYLCNSIGLVDSFLYRGEIKLIFKNRTPISQNVMDILYTAWNAMPWYKKIFKNYIKWLNENSDVANFTAVSNALAEAPYQAGDKIGQLVWVNFPTVSVKKVDTKEELSTTERGEGGFGSTGK